MNCALKKILVGRLIEIKELFVTIIFSADATAINIQGTVPLDTTFLEFTKLPNGQVTNNARTMVQFGGKRKCPVRAILYDVPCLT